VNPSPHSLTPTLHYSFFKTNIRIRLIAQGFIEKQRYAFRTSLHYITLHYITLHDVYTVGFDVHH
jgi:hypothetical protein